MIACVLKALLLAIFIADSLAYRGYWKGYHSQGRGSQSWKSNSRTSSGYSSSDTAYSSGMGRLFHMCAAHNKEPWTYKGQNGPAFWKMSYPECDGNEQSPIDIKSKEAKKDEHLEQLYFINYDKPIAKAMIENNGHSIEITPNDDVIRKIVVDENIYTLRQFHFHWGSVYFKGSEHTIDGIQYAMEMHFVHMNENNEIAVVAVLFQEESNDNPELQKMIDELKKVQYKDSEAEMECSLIIEHLLPCNPASFYRYMGSLTTPACAEGVIWSVLPEPIPVGRDQMDVFRELYSATKEDASESCKLVDNYRPVQSLNNRQVYRSL